MLSMEKLSHSWKRLSTQTACYHLVEEQDTWVAAEERCQSIDDESRLVQNFPSIDVYALFKVFLKSIVRDTIKLDWWPSEWWMGLLQNGHSLQWSNSPEREVQFVDWDPHTDFSMSKTAGVLAFDTDISEFRWKLKDLSSEKKSICEMQNCTYSHPTLAYIEDQTSKSIKGNNYTAALRAFKLLCVPSGWYVARSISWFKDGIPILPNTAFNEFRFVVYELEANLENILPFQGYYWCSVDQEQPAKPVFSPKVLFRLPGLHTFVLYFQSPDLFTDVNACSEFTTNLQLPQSLFELLSKTTVEFETAVLRNVTCERSAIHYYIHIYVRESADTEEKVFKTLENSILPSIEKLGNILDEGDGTFRNTNSQIDRSTFSLRSTVACPEEKVTFHSYTTTWPTTLIGIQTKSKELCIDDKSNVIERACLGDFNFGAFWGPINKECSDQTPILTAKLYKLSNRKVITDNIFNTSLQVETLIAATEDLSSADVQYVSQILGNMATVQDIQPKVFSSVINTVDRLIGVKGLRRENTDSKSNVSSQISSAIESMLSNLDTHGQVFKAAARNIAVSVFPHASNTTFIQTGGVLTSWNSNLTSIFNGTSRKELYSTFDTLEAGVLLPENLVAEKQNKKKEDVTISIHRNFHFIQNVEVVSPIIGVSLGSVPVFDVDPPVEMIFKVPEMKRNFSYDCVFWDQSLNDNFGGWSYKGCMSHYLDSSHLRCSCNHLTSFAVILELRPGSEISEVHKRTLSSITYIGCALSISGLGVIILTYVLFRKWRNDLKHKALFNLSLALFSFLLIFVVGVEKRSSVYGCMVVAALLHYFMLASFAWMLVEAFMQYLSLVKVIGTYIPRFMQKAVLFAWGVPVIIIVIMLGINYQLYNSKHKYCWVSDKAFYYAVAGPVLAMLAMNFVIFALILYSNTCGRPNNHLRTNQNERQETMTRAKAIFCVSILLGLSWIFGFLAVDGAKLVFQYLFAVTTTLQGFFIFIFFVLRQKNTRDLWLNLLTPTTSPEISRISHITGGTDFTSRTAHQLNGKESRLSKAVFRARLSYVTFKG